MQQIKRLIKATGYSLAGLKAAFQSEPAFVLEVILAIVLIPIAFLLPVALLAKALLISSIILVLIVELINSGLEAVVNRISEERHPLSKKAKDVGSAAVFLSLVNVVVIWVLVLF